MRKVIFTINDLEWFKGYYKLSEEQFKDIFKQQKAFECLFALIGNGNNVNKYILTDKAGNKLNINDLNGFERGVIINDCYAYFEGRNYVDNSTEPCGVIDIQETEISEVEYLNLIEPKGQS